MYLQTFKDQLIESLTPDYQREEINHFYYLLVENYLDENRFLLAKHPKFVIPEEKTHLFNLAKDALVNHCPIQYVIGSGEFLGLNLKIKPGVLIPRPETEDLVVFIRERFRGSEMKKIADIGTGSGCIGLSLKKDFPNAEVHLYDISEKALDIAAQNARDNQLEVYLHSMDVLKTSEMESNFDLIVSNPPYVCESEKSLMRPNVLEYEPELALFVSDSDPLLFYRKIAKLASESLMDSGSLFFEINERFSKETKTMLEDMGFVQVTVFQDRYNKPRIVEAIK